MKQRFTFFSIMQILILQDKIATIDANILPENEDSIVNNLLFGKLNSEISYKNYLHSIFWTLKAVIDQNLLPKLQLYYSINWKSFRSLVCGIHLYPEFYVVGGRMINNIFNFHGDPITIGQYTTQLIDILVHYLWFLIYLERSSCYWTFSK